MARSFLASNSEKIDYGNPSVLNITTGGLSISGWINRADATMYNVVMTRRTSNSLQYQLTWVKNNENTGHNNAIRLDLGLGGGIVSFNSTSVFSQTGSWHYIAATYDGAHVVVYFDGVAYGSTAESRNIDTYAVHNFTGYDGTTSYASATLAEIGIWHGGLSLGEIVALANGILPFRVRPLSLVGYWPLWGLSSSEPDLSSNGNNGVLTGTAYATHAPVTTFTRKSRNVGYQTMTVPYSPGTPILGQGVY